MIALEFGHAERLVQFLHAASGLSAAGGKSARLNLMRLLVVRCEGDMESYREMLLQYERVAHIVWIQFLISSGRSCHSVCSGTALSRRQLQIIQILFLFSQLEL